MQVSYIFVANCTSLWCVDAAHVPGSGDSDCTNSHMLCMFNVIVVLKFPVGNFIMIVPCPSKIDVHANVICAEAIHSVK